jgi:hypothetical protein
MADHSGVACALACSGTGWITPVGRAAVGDPHAVAFSIDLD